MFRGVTSRLGIAAAMVALVFIVLPPTAWASRTSQPAPHHAARPAPRHTASPAIRPTPRQIPVNRSPHKMPIPIEKSPATHHRILDKGLSPKMHEPVKKSIPIAIVPKHGPVKNPGPLKHQAPLPPNNPVVHTAPRAPHSPANSVAQKKSNGAPTTKLAAKFRDDNTPMPSAPTNTATPPSTALTPQETSLAIDILSVLSQSNLSEQLAPPIIPKLRGTPFLYPPEILPEPGTTVLQAAETSPPSGLTYVTLPKTDPNPDPPAIPTTPPSLAPQAPEPPQPSSGHYTNQRASDICLGTSIGAGIALVLSLLL